MRIVATTLIKHNGNYFQQGQEVTGLTETEISKLLAANSVKVFDGQIAPEQPENALDTPPDKTLEDKETARVANLPISMKLKKTALIGIARANGLKVEKTATAPEVYNMIKKYREDNGIVIEDQEPEEKPQVKNPEAPAEEEVKAADEMEKSEKTENAPGGEPTPEGEAKDEGKEEAKEEAETPKKEEVAPKGKGKK